MARIVVQTDDRRTVFEEQDVQLGDIADERTSVALLDRLEEAIGQAQAAPRRRALRRVVSLVPAQDYRDVSG